MDRKYIIGGVMGFVLASLLSVDISDAAIPPTRALQSLNITLPWYGGGDVLVDTDSSSDVFHFVSDGSITFNVTETYP